MAEPIDLKHAQACGIVFEMLARASLEDLLGRPVGFVPGFGPDGVCDDRAQITHDGQVYEIVVRPA